MKICSFTVKNYRSITKAYKMPFFDKSILIGPNNEGKSNILHGLVLVLNSLRHLELSGARRRKYWTSDLLYRHYESVSFDWGRDFPIHRQQQYPKGASEFTIEFELTEEDKENFRKLVRSHFATNLKLKLQFYANTTLIDIVMPGPGKRKLERKYDLISRFLRKNINLQYIQAVRTTEDVIDLIEHLLSEELSTLESNSEYVRGRGMALWQFPIHS